MKFGGRNDCSRVVLLMVAVYFLPCFITLIVRVPPYGDVAPKSADMDAALLYEAEEVTDPCDVPRRLHESSVKNSATASKDDARNLKDIW